MRAGLCTSCSTQTGVAKYRHVLPKYRQYSTRMQIYRHTNGWACMHTHQHKDTLKQSLGESMHVACLFRAVTMAPRIWFGGVGRITEEGARGGS